MFTGRLILILTFCLILYLLFGLVRQTETLERSVNTVIVEKKPVSLPNIVVFCLNKRFLCFSDHRLLPSFLSVLSLNRCCIWAHCGRELLKQHYYFPLTASLRVNQH